MKKSRSPDGGRIRSGTGRRNQAAAPGEPRSGSGAGGRSEDPERNDVRNRKDTPGRSGTGAPEAAGSMAAPAAGTTAFGPQPPETGARGIDSDPLTYEEIRRLLASVFREAPGPLEVQVSVCEILYEELDHYSWVGIYMVDGDELELTAWSGPEATQHTRIKIGEGICGLAASTGETEVVADVRQNERFIACFPSTRSEIVVPIVRDREVLGEIDVDSDLLDAFDEQDVRLLEWTAARLASLA